MNYDEYGFPIFDDDFDVSIITAEVKPIKDKEKTETKEEKPKEVKHTQPLF